MNISDRIKHAWNAFMNKDPTEKTYIGPGDYRRPDRIKILTGNERSMMTSAFNRIALDCASIEIRHVRLDEENRYIEDMDSTLNDCLVTEANIDQTARAFRQDIVMSMFDEGSVAIVPVDVNKSPNLTSSYDILTMRTGKITQWYPQHVKVNVYNEKTGKKEDVTLPKKFVSIIENPLYAVVNEPNSTAKRLIRKLNLLDAVDEQAGSGKLDLIVQLPYTVKTETRRKQAEDRRKDIEDQLKNSKYGIAYIDSTEKVTQMNRPIENNLMKQVEYLTNLLLSQLGITQSVLDGTADEKTMQNYYNRTIEPIMSSIVEEMRRKFLTKTARSQKQSILFFRDPFKLLPISSIADTADKFTRNEILTPNEFRQIIGRRPSADPKSDELRNRNISQPNEEMGMPEEGFDTGEGGETDDDIVNELLANLEEQIKQIVEQQGGEADVPEDELEEEYEDE